MDINPYIVCNNDATHSHLTSGVPNNLTRVVNIDENTPDLTENVVLIFHINQSPIYNILKIFAENANSVNFNHTDERVRNHVKWLIGNKNKIKAILVISGGNIGQSERSGILNVWENGNSLPPIYFPDISQLNTGLKKHSPPWQESNLENILEEIAGKGKLETFIQFLTILLCWGLLLEKDPPNAPASFCGIIKDISKSKFEKLISKRIIGIITMERSNIQPGQWDISGVDEAMKIRLNDINHALGNGDGPIGQLSNQMNTIIGKKQASEYFEALSKMRDKLNSDLTK